VVAKVHGQIRKHLDGALLGPAMVALSRGGVLDGLTQGPVTVRSLEEAAGLPEIVFDLVEPRKDGSRCGRMSPN
jgi:hypothetical protein